MYQPKPGQFQHQKDDLAATWNKPGYGKFWEQGTGKTRDYIDTGGALYDAKEIGGLFLVAPNGLHRQFVERELPKHMPGEVLERCRAMFYRTDRATTKWHKEEARAMLAHDGLRVLGMSYDGIMTEPGRALAKEFLTTTRCLYGLDESQRIKEPGTGRTVRVLASSKYAPYRRVMSGTPVANAPWDIYTQIKFVDGDYWKRFQLDDIAAMRTQFGEWESGFRYVRAEQARWPSGALKRGYSDRGNNTFVLEYPKLVTTFDGRPVYKNLEQLEAMVAPIRSRVLKDDVFDLPPKLYTPLEFDMSPAQRRAYDSLRKLGFVVQDGHQMTATMALTVLLRLQQIACGYLVSDLEPGDEEPTVVPIVPNPRLDALLELTADIDHQGIIWARFHHDIDQICEGLRKQGRTFARYDGTLSDDECAANEERFHKGQAQWFVATQSKGGEGLTLTEAKTVIYYSNTFKLTERLQSEDRPHRWGQTSKVNYIDLIARDTVDVKLINRLMAKLEVAQTVLGDGLREWLKI